MNTNQKSSQRHQTSLFSEYENNSNNSISSKQLELWLQQMAPTSHTSPKFSQDWNLMSTSSRYQSDGMTFGARLDTFQSANKQNISVKANFAIEPSKSLLKENHYQSLSQPQSSQKCTASKSYINAMKQLQKRAKTLEEDNANMRKSLQIFQEQKRISLQSSMIESEELKSKLVHFEEAERKIDEMKKENKKLRDSKNEQTQKIKLMEKSINDQKSKVKTFEQRLDNLSKENEELKRELIDSSNMTKSLMIENKQLALKAETLENMKEKSTNSVLEKYAKALEKNEQLELMIGQLKTKGNMMEERQKKVLEQKDLKYFSLMETVNSLKLEKQQLMMRLENSNCEVESKLKQVKRFEQQVKSLQGEFLEQSKQILTLKTIILQKDDKILELNQSFSKSQAKSQKLKSKIKKLQQKHFKELQCLKEKNPIFRASECISQSDESSKSQQIQLQNPQYETNLSHIIDQNQKQEDTPVERYEHDSPNFENNEPEEFITLAKPLSIIINAKNQQPRIKSEEAEAKVNDHGIESSEEEESLENEKIITIKTTQKPIKRKSIESKKIPQENIINNHQMAALKEAKQPKSQHKESLNSSNSRRPSLQESKYLIPASNLKREKNEVKIAQNSSGLSSHHRSKSSSIEKKKICEKKSSSMDSKRKSISQKKSKQNTSQKSKVMIKQSEPSQSRYVNDTYMCMSVEPTRYQVQVQHPEHYYYTNEINSKGNFEVQRHINQEEFQSQNYSIHAKSMIGKSGGDVKKALNKALLLEYQEEALKLYEEHEKLLCMSENESDSPQEKAEIIGRMRQVMSMIDRNTEKIFELKGRPE